MDTHLKTPRLHLTLITSIDPESEELQWCHQVRSDEKASWWSISGCSTSLSQTREMMQAALPLDPAGDTRRVLYAVHEIPPSFEPEGNTRLVGLVALKTPDGSSLNLPPSLFPDLTPNNVITAELSYSLLPSSWGKGFATEAINAVLAACKTARAFWEPWERVYVRAIVNGENGPSQGVMRKVGEMERLGEFEWRGESIFFAGRWRERDDLIIYGGWVV